MAASVNMIGFSCQHRVFCRIFAEHNIPDNSKPYHYVKQEVARRAQCADQCRAVVGLPLSLHVARRREQGFQGGRQLVLHPVPRGAGPCPYLHELPPLARCRG